MSPALLPRIAVLFALLLAGFWLTTGFIGLPWVISGGSMEPGLSHGDRVIVDVWTYRQRTPRPSEVVLLRGPLPQRPILVKRASAPSSAGTIRPLDGRWPSGPHRTGVWVLGDHSAGSTDSRHFGSVPSAEVRGRVVLRYWPPRKAGLIR